MDNVSCMEQKKSEAIEKLSTVTKNNGRFLLLAANVQQHLSQHEYDESLVVKNYREKWNQRANFYGNNIIVWITKR